MSPGPGCLLPLLWLCALSRPGLSQGPTAPNASRPVFLCGGEHSGDAGYVASEGFPNFYPPNSDCTWTITVPEGQVVMLTFRVLDLEPDSSCRHDFLEVLSGAQRLARVCGTLRPGTILTPGRRVQLRMVSDEATSGRGFLLWFSGALPHVNDQQFCGGRLEKPQGTIKTPNWPESDYPAGISCSWHIIAPPGKVIELTWGKFDVEADTYCRYDYVSVFQGGQSDDARRVGRFCGDTSPVPIISEGRELLVQFVSDLSVTADGFAATYAARDPEELAERGPSPVAPPPLPPVPEPGTGKGKGGKDPGKAKPPPTAPAPPPLAPEGQLPSTVPTGPIACPKTCRRTGTLQSNFCASDFVLTGTVKAVTRGPGEGVTATVAVVTVYKAGALALPQPHKGASLRLAVPCRQCPQLKKGASYILMGQLDTGGPWLPPESFVVQFRPPQHQVLTNLSKRSCLPRPQG
ncbi:procollagen C-endopeptidase enhancer 1 isoform X2 [Alligator mississippiensis]|uniref:Procollagen C-endopeptidase enhancer 1 n=1 Tax=Alligator mississippiensis TaxID=8496 RepID=A0A151M8P5_ALLMI|nr:procollagen C-endopeptidase enhancer 1 isoform X2 [Alligator mississippiensis]KYO20882.1 procollagen C-endopeptidase enhancer 1 [Alligator mississippiensis]